MNGSPGLPCFNLGAGPVGGATPDVVGTKAYGLLRLTQAGLRVPPAATSASRRTPPAAR